MLVKFFGEPLKEIKGALSGKVIFRFDHKGEFYTDDPEFIERAKGHFDHIECEVKETGERVKKTIATPTIQITTADERENNSAGIPCKHCGQTFDDALALARHTKKEHKA